MVLVPGAITLSDPLKSALAATQAQVILGPRTNAKTAALSIPVPLPPAIPGLDVTISRVESLRPNMPIPALGGGSVTTWLEDIESREKVLEATFDGAPVLVAKDNLAYLAGWPDPTLLARILYRAAIAAGLDPIGLPEDIRIRDTGRTRFVFNHGPEPVEFDGQTIAPAGLIWTRT
jgi:beta-galactosidase